MKVAVTLPQFRTDPRPALVAASLAEEAGLDGVFVFDHLWPLRQPGRPALAAFPLLAAVAARTEQVVVGTLVARVGLLPDAVLLHHFRTLARLAPGRLVAGLGIGDELSRGENEAYGIPFEDGTTRRERMAGCCRALRAAGITAWVGGNAEATRSVAVAEADALNLWESPPEVVAAETRIPVTWGGHAGDDLPGLAARLRDMRSAGASWAVCAPPYGTAPDPAPAVAMVAAAAREAV